MYLVDDRLGQRVVAIELRPVGVDQIKAAVDGAGVHRANLNLSLSMYVYIQYIINNIPRR